MKAKTIKLAGYQIQFKPLPSGEYCSVRITRPKESKPYIGFVSNIENAEEDALIRLVADVKTNFKVQQTI